MDRVPWQSLWAHVFVQLRNQYVPNFTLTIDLPEGPEIWDGDLGTMDFSGDTFQEVVGKMVKALTLLDFRGSIELADETERTYYGHINFWAEKPTAKCEWDLIRRDFLREEVNT